MRRVVATFFIAILCFSCPAAATKQTGDVNAQARAARKMEKKQQKAQRKYAKQQRKAQRKMENYDRKHTHDPNRPR